MKGIGDLIAKITHATGIDKAVKAVVGEDCGCDERQEYLNKFIPFRKRKKPDNKEDLDRDVLLSYLVDLKNRGNANRTDQEILWEAHRMYVNPKSKPTTCTKCAKKALDDLIKTLSE